MIRSSVVIICSDSWIVCIIICASLSLFDSSTAPSDRPSASIKSCSILPLCLSLFLVHSPILHHGACCVSACCWPKHNSRRRPLSMLVLSRSETHHLNRHMVVCGCHERSDQSPQLIGVYGMVRVPRNLGSAYFQCPVLDLYLSASSSVSLSTTVSQIEGALHKMAISSED